MRIYFPVLLGNPRVIDHLTRAPNIERFNRVFRVFATSSAVGIFFFAEFRRTEPVRADVFIYLFI